MATLTPDVYQDDIALLFARIMTVANKRARESGVDVGQSLITVAQRPSNDGMLWRVSYGPQNYVGRRGGDLVIDIDPDDASVKQVLRGQ